MTTATVETFDGECPRDFPKFIQTALSRLAGRVGAAAALSFKERALLQELVRNYTHHASIRVSNDALSKALGMATRTVQRFKRALEKSGWITRHQVQSRRYGMQISDIALTPMAKSALGLDGEVFQRAPKNHHASEKISELQKRQPAGDFLEKNIQIPNDLQLLTDMGITPAAVCKLMGMCSSKGFRLSEVVTVVRSKLNSQAIKYPFLYLKKIIAAGAGKDWTALSAKVSEAEQVKQEQDQRTAVRKRTGEAFEAMAKAWGSVRYRNDAGTHTFQIISNVLYVRKEGGPERVISDASVVIEQWKAGKINA